MLLSMLFSVVVNIMARPMPSWTAPTSCQHHSFRGETTVEAFWWCKTTQSSVPIHYRASFMCRTLQNKKFGKSLICIALDLRTPFDRRFSSTILDPKFTKLRKHALLVCSAKLPPLFFAEMSHLPGRFWVHRVPTLPGQLARPIMA